MWIERAARVALIAASQFIEIKVSKVHCNPAAALFVFVFRLLYDGPCNN